MGLIVVYLLQQLGGIMYIQLRILRRKIASFNHDTSAT